METEWYEHHTPWIIVLIVCVTIVSVYGTFASAFVIPAGVEIRQAGDAIVIELPDNAKAVVFVGERHFRVPVEDQ